MNWKGFLSISILCWHFSLSGQVTDSIKVKEKFPLAEYFLEKNFSPNSSVYTAIDTSLEGVQKYFPNNFSYSLGLSNRKLFFEPSTNIGFQSGFSNLDLFGYNKEAIKYYRTRSPYTEVFGVFGMKKEQFSRLLHTQNITRQWNIALNMLRIRSEGFYQRQNCSDNNISLSTNYVSKNNRYSLLANGIISSIKSDENGGIKYDSIFEVRLLESKKLIPVNLTNARTKRRNREIYIKQSLYFGKSRKGEDPSSSGKGNVMKGDSVISSSIRPTNALSYSFRMSDEEFVYAETKLDSGYYENIFFDSIQTHDSTHTEEFIHGLEAQTILVKKIKINLGIEQRNRRLVQYATDSSRTLEANFTDQVVHMEIGSTIDNTRSKGFFWKVGKRYILKGDHEGDDHIYATSSYIFNKKSKISFEYFNALRSIPFLYNYYSSNHFLWSNSFEKITESQLKLKYKDVKNKFSLGAEMNQVTGYVYFDSTFLPRQYDTSITILSAFAQKNIHLKHFGFNNQVAWQDVSAANVIRLPQFVTNHSIYYEGKWFRKAVDVQLGFDVTYYFSYFADAYMPALGHYYLQNEKEFGNYPFIDFFLNMKIKRARIFVKSEHVNSGFMGANYFLAPHMPGPDRSIKVGVRWAFYD